MNLLDFICINNGQTVRSIDSTDVNWMQGISKQGTNNKRALMMIHGFSSTPAVFREIVPKLTQYDAIAAYPLPGHAENIQAFQACKFTEWKHACMQNFVRLNDTYDKVDVLGLSLGGLLACDLSLQVDINHLYLLAPALKLVSNEKYLKPLVSILQCFGFQSIRNKGGNIISKQYGEIAYNRLPLTTIYEILSLIESFHFELPSCPTDVFLGRFDKVVNSDAIFKLFSPSKHASIHYLEHSAHVLPLDNDLLSIVHTLNQCKD